MKFKSLLLVVGFIPALAMAEIAKPAPEKAPPVGARPAVVETQVAKPTAPEKAPAVVARPAVVTHVYHHHYHYHHRMHFQPQYMYQPPPEIHHYYQSGPPQISGKPRMEGRAREEMIPPEMIMPHPYWVPMNFGMDAPQIQMQTMEK